MSKVVVITGASSGMGRATALRLAGRGDSVVVSARRASILDEVVRECERAGGKALAVPADVTDEQAVREVAQSALGEFGRFDAWVNTAAAQSFGKLWDVPTPTLRRVVDVVLVGSVIVSKVALDHFRSRGEGTLVLVSSVLGKTPTPYLNVYDAAKHGVVGLAGSLRAELKEEGLAERVKVCNLMPPSTDTPFYVHAANYAGRVPRPPPPVYSVETLAEAIVEAVDDPQDDVTVGAMGKLMRAAHGAMPGLYESLTAPFGKGMFTNEPAPRTHGNVFEPIPEGVSADGGWKRGAPLKRT